MADRIKIRRDTAAVWTSVNPILADGEIGFERDTLKVKVGNGTDNWITLPYVTGVGAFVQTTGHTMTGPLAVPAGASGAQVPQAQEALLKADNLSGLANVASARTNLGLGSAATRTALGTTGSLYSRDSILGTVSQSGGEPTGAILERGSNANGSYVRFADGTQLALRSATSSSSASVGVLFAAGFSSTPNVFVTANTTSAVFGAIHTTDTAGFQLDGWLDSGARAAVGFNVCAIGRWF